MSCIFTTELLSQTVWVQCLWKLVSAKGNWVWLLRHPTYPIATLVVCLLDTFTQAKFYFHIFFNAVIPYSFMKIGNLFLWQPVFIFADILNDHCFVGDRNEHSPVPSLQVTKLTTIIFLVSLTRLNSYRTMLPYFLYLVASLKRKGAFIFRNRTNSTKTAAAACLHGRANGPC